MHRRLLVSVEAICLAAGVGGFFLGCAGEARAQTAAAPETVVVTARLREEDAQSVPVSLSVVGGATLDSTFTNNLQQLAQLGVTDEAAARAVRAFTGVPHRLEPVAVVGGVQWVNDSIATAPERTLAGMRAFTEPLVLLLGGRDKNLPTRVLGEEAVRRCRAVITFGEASDLYASAIRDAEDALPPWK